MALEVAYSERKFWCRAQLGEEVHLNTIGREDIGYYLGKILRVVTTVIGNDYLHLLIGIYLFEVVAQSLGILSQGIAVHTIGTNTHDPAHTSCTKFQILMKTFGKLLRISCK